MNYENYLQEYNQFIFELIGDYTTLHENQSRIYNDLSN